MFWLVLAFLVYCIAGIKAVLLMIAMYAVYKAVLFCMSARIIKAARKLAASMN